MHADEYLSSLGAAEVAALLERGTERTFVRGQALMHEGQVPDRVLVLRGGTVKVFTTTASGKEVVLAVRGCGELVGELAALAGAERTASVVAIEPVTAIVLTQDAFRAFLLAHPPASLALLGTLARRLRDADAKRAEFAAFTTLGRVALRLLELADRFGTAEGAIIHIALPLSQEELAGWSGASLESVGRALQTMRSLAWIETGRRDIRILDVDALRRAAA
ncbi:MAG: family transcriptional regulator, cyclic receptor protein [Solirubrobacteraceae bacterium]|jgi:CRP-like cAMP-binding protein|nr:family transcriptional regulator, cyclic receptor protein [Solirubrobacteraceae bacterium]